MPKTRIYTDGSATEICYVIGNQKPVRQPARESGAPVTVNEGEYLACLAGLNAARKQGLQDVEVWADSELMVKQLTLDADRRPLYECRNDRLKQLRLLVMGMGVYFDSMSFIWVSREENLAGKELERKPKRGRK